MCAQNMRELTPPGAETFYSPSFHDSLKKPLDLRLPIVLQKLVCGVWECRFSPNRKKRFSISISSVDPRAVCNQGQRDFQYGQLLRKRQEQALALSYMAN